MRKREFFANFDACFNDEILAGLPMTRKATKRYKRALAEFKKEIDKQFDNPDPAWRTWRDQAARDLLALRNQSVPKRVAKRTAR